MKKITLAIAFLFAGIFCFSQSIFLDVENSIEDTPEGQPVLAYAFGMSNSGSSHIGGGAGKATLQDISISSEIGRISAVLQKSVALGIHFPAMRIKFYNLSKKLYYQITLEEVMVTSYQSGAACGNTPCTTISENYTLAYKKIKIENFTAGNSFDFDIATNSQF